MSPRRPGGSSSTLWRATWPTSRAAPPPRASTWARWPARSTSCCAAWPACGPGGRCSASTRPCRPRSSRPASASTTAATGSTSPSSRTACWSGRGPGRPSPSRSSSATRPSSSAQAPSTSSPWSSGRDRGHRAAEHAARQLAPGDGIDETEFWSVDDAQRQAQGGPLSRTVATRFLPSGDPEELNQLARSQFQVPAASMYPDARPTLAALATRYKLGVVANPSEQHIAALKRDGLMQYFDVVVHPEQVDLAKTPSSRMWKRALEKTGVQANRAVHVGNRIDNDIRPAKQAGLHTIWLLRGEAPPSPTVEQLAEADAIVTTFSGVPNALVAISPSRISATTA